MDKKEQRLETLYGTITATEAKRVKTDAERLAAFITYRQDWYTPRMNNLLYRELEKQNINLDAMKNFEGILEAIRRDTPKGQEDPEVIKDAADKVFRGQ